MIRLHEIVDKYVLELDSKGRVVRTPQLYRISDEVKDTLGDKINENRFDFEVKLKRISSKDESYGKVYKTIDDIRELEELGIRPELVSNVMSEAARIFRYFDNNCKLGVKVRKYPEKNQDTAILTLGGNLIYKASMMPHMKEPYVQYSLKKLKWNYDRQLVEVCLPYGEAYRRFKRDGEEVMIPNDILKHKTFLRFKPVLDMLEIPYWHVKYYISDGEGVVVDAVTSRGESCKYTRYGEKFIVEIGSVSVTEVETAFVLTLSINLFNDVIAKGEIDEVVIEDERIKYVRDGEHTFELIYNDNTVIRIKEI